MKKLIVVLILAIVILSVSLYSLFSSLTLDEHLMCAGIMLSCAIPAIILLLKINKELGK
jgi:NADH:ubiquinone oxidoreductase subunit K